jgi:hypothetical protein
MSVFPRWLGAARSVGAAAAAIALAAAATLSGATPAVADPPTTMWVVADGSPIEASGKNIDIRFEGAAGRHLRIECLGQAGSSPVLNLRTPGGDWLRSDPVCSSDPGAWRVVAETAALPETGEYTLNVFAYREFTRTLRIAVVSDTVVPLADDVEQRVHPELPHANVALAFDGVAGERIHIDCFTYALESRPYGTIPQIELLLLGPDNKVIPATDQDPRECFAFRLGEPRVDGTAADLALPASGSYLLMVDYSRVTIPTRDTLVRLHRTPAQPIG